MKRTTRSVSLLGAGIALTLLLVVGGIPAAAQETFVLADVAFLTGCWSGQMGSLDMREQWTADDGGTMLSTTKFIRNGQVVDFEFGRIVESEEGITLWPYPRGTISEHGFPLTRAGAEYVFENLEHDFPVRIIYVRDGRDGLLPRIEGTDGQGPSWSLHRVECPVG